MFPFSYKGVTYNECTYAESANGDYWCATQVKHIDEDDNDNNDVLDQVDADGHVVIHSWQDCQDGCPGTCMNGNYFGHAIIDEFLQMVNAARID